VYLDRVEAMRFLNVEPEWWNANRPQRMRSAGGRGNAALYRLADLLPVLAKAPARLGAA